MSDKYPPIHPGRVLELEHMEPLEMTKYKLAQETGLSESQVGGIVNGKRSITAETALRFADVFRTSAEYWMNLQMHYDLRVARATAAKAPRLRPLKTPRKSAAKRAAKKSRSTKKQHQ